MRCNRYKVQRALRGCVQCKTIVQNWQFSREKWGCKSVKGKAVTQSGWSGSDAVVPSTGQQQSKEPVCRVGGVSSDAGCPAEASVVCLLYGGRDTLMMSSAVFTIPCSSLQLAALWFQSHIVMELSTRSLWRLCKSWWGWREEDFSDFSAVIGSRAIVLLSWQQLSS